LRISASWVEMFIPKIGSVYCLDRENTRKSENEAYLGSQKKRKHTVKIPHNSSKINPENESKTSEI
jgi:hypothetical protein